MQQKSVRSSSESYFWPTVWAVAIHALLFAMLFVSFAFTPELPPAREVLSESRTLRGGGAAGAATVGAAGVEVLQDVLAETQTTIQPLVPYLDTLRWVLIAIALIGISKRFGPVQANRDVSLSVAPGSIHGIEPQGLPHFDLLWKYSPDALIKPAARADNVEWWGASYMKEFYARYPFVTEMTPDAQKQVDAYFAGPAWARYCDLNEHRDVVHIHANVETSLHPDLILKPALAAMKKRGWDIHEVVPVAFQMRGQMHGKLVFIADKPEKIFDIAWCFNPTVALIPSTRYWLTTEDPTYDARTMAELPLLLKRDPYRLLSLAEVEAVVEAI